MARTNERLWISTGAVLQAATGKGNNADYND